ncbi:NADH/ubiquinone/plastoquinone (complex I) [Oscillochloris trichoides DG-6]|uniref:NADH/ubiquinone/plastoquinone (Complex I) n=1 Tax=Oscillochloris trichoides DG-6 TaxID=765420 RepID=E1IHD5_9CHLR|nr:proton-conducting transporter membrane subunit [Oscillochloris trichoides]EFO79388.1 NADH/ubiquinone/plastoquinone (complex I) [Oscillochloris trichoides DG-6]
MLYLLLIFFPITMALSAFVLRKNSGQVIFVGLGTVITLMLVATQIPLDDPTRFLGITLMLSSLNRMFMLLFLAISGFAFVAAWHLPHGENFVPTVLLILSEVCAVLLLQNTFLTTLLLGLTGLSAVLAIVDLPVDTSSLVGTRTIAAALKYMVLMVLAAILMYIAFVLTDIFRPGELPGRISLARFILALLAVSFALRMALIPFHAWLVDLMEHASLLVVALVVTLLNTSSMLVLLLVFQSFPTLLIENEAPLMVLRIGALISALLGAGMAFGSDTLRRGMAYLILYDGGVVFYGLASVSSLGLAGAVFGAINQTLAVVLLLVSLALIERPDGRPPGVVRRDLLRRWPVAGAGFLAGGLALIGMPPLGGAMSRLLIYQAAAEQHWIELLVLLTATLLAGLALARMAQERLLGPGEDAAAPEPLMLGETEFDRLPPRRLASEPTSAAALTLTLVLICVAIGLYPGPLLANIDGVIRELAFIRAL